MPELPEVETIRRQMERSLKRRKIRDVKVRFAGCLRGITKKAFIRRVKGASFSRFGRRAKLLLLYLSNDETIVAHLKITGRFLLADKGEKPTKHTHVIFELADGLLFWEDARKFGWLKLVSAGDLEEKIFLSQGYGPEPLKDDFTEEGFRRCLEGRSGKMIKPLLMEQACAAGIGNINADETLWKAKVHPERTAGSLSRREAGRLYRAIKEILREALKHRGASVDMYLDLHGREGEQISHLRAYGREGEMCYRHPKEKILKKRVGGRGTYLCPKCQER